MAPTGRAGASRASSGGGGSVCERRAAAVRGPMGAGARLHAGGADGAEQKSIGISGVDESGDELRVFVLFHQKSRGGLCHDPWWSWSVVSQELTQIPRISPITKPRGGQRAKNPAGRCS